MSNTDKIRKQIFSALQSAYCEMGTVEFTDFCKELTLTIDNYPKQNSHKHGVMQGLTDLELLNVLHNVKRNRTQVTKAFNKIKGSPTVASEGEEKSVCDGCEDIAGFYLGTTCPKCSQPFRQVK